MFVYDLQSVINWGSPWWRVHDIMYARNAKIDKLTAEDDILTWKAMLVTLANTISKYHLPKRMSGYTAQKQWRQDLFADAAALLWQIIKSAHGKLLSVKGTVGMAIKKAARDSRVHKIPDNFDIDKFMDVFGLHKFVEPDPSEWMANRIDEREFQISVESLARRRVLSRAQIANEKVQESIKKTLSGLPTKMKIGRDLVTVYRRLAFHELRKRTAREI
ncbi:MAG: hypothetical protein E6R03_08955 [Hyphomicrobiaceae bacterium]|nr:MAG: hypothetical protein E6R03_08955 [Hyphomicrobiaceae bacterium]